jgi:thiosulfate/3-mercaptopyruvate sulfurtransferase
MCAYVAEIIVEERVMEQEITQKGYAHPEALVSTQWVQEHLDDPKVRIVESDEDVLLYDIGHIPNAVKIDWVEDLNDSLVRDYLDPEHFARLMSEKGISPETQVVFYGDKNNWWATYALWVFRLFGHDNVVVMDGGRVKWEAEEKEMTQEVPSFPRTDYPVPTRDDEKIRAFKEDVERHIEARKPLVDVRSPGEYSGELLHMPDYPQEGALRGGHIPGAANVPWARAVRRMGRSRVPTSCERSTRGRRASARMTTWWRTAGSGSGRLTRGSCLRTC